MAQHAAPSDSASVAWAKRLKEDSNQPSPKPKIIASGAQVVIQVPAKKASGKTIHPQGAVGMVVKVLVDDAVGSFTTCISGLKP